MATNDPYFPDFRDFQRYTEGAMPPEEQHRLEKRMLDDPFVAEAYEGYLLWSNGNAEAIAPQADLHRKLAARTARRKAIVPVWAYGAAASVVVAVAFVGYYLSYVEPQAHVPVSGSSVVTENGAIPSPSEPEKLEAEDAPEKLPAPVPPKKAMPDPPLLGADKAPTGVAQAEESAVAIPDSTMELAQSQPAPATSAPGAPLPDQAFAKSLYARTKTTVPSMRLVSGRVIGVKGEALAGVQVRSSSDSDGITDSDGFFKVSAKDTDSLRLSVMGFNAKTVPVSDQDLGTIRLEEHDQVLAEQLKSRKGAAAKPAIASAIGGQSNSRPVPVNGWQRYQAYLDSATRSSGTEGKVTVSFVVNADGTLSHLFATGNDALKKQAVRIVREGPAWVPVLRNGQVVLLTVEVDLYFRKSE